MENKEKGENGVGTPVKAKATREDDVNRLLPETYKLISFKLPARKGIKKPVKSEAWASANGSSSESEELSQKTAESKKRSAGHADSKTPTKKVKRSNSDDEKKPKAIKTEGDNFVDYDDL
ncbi:hypothetical protein XA68_13941 [Ophiocordyceps unilateralis]|uniref:Uncharacterized protein n=1 Tax=Ophiocordyceps unilateralis TaxID=268505 RepID=A0A2A9PN82_OPHUN|nr:hypothetical protein XA68_13941 [Ophiocordyceps unilateralis]